MDFRDLQYLLIIAEEGSISKAAERLFMSQSSLSQTLQGLEGNLGAPIFERSNRGVCPTEAGQRLLARGRQIVDIYRDAANEFRDRSGQVSGTLEFGTASFRGQFLIPPALQEYYRLYPQVRVHITELNSNRLERLIGDGSLDLALTALPSAEHANCAVDSRFRDEMVIVASRAHPIMEKVHSSPDGRLWVCPEDAAVYEFILSDPNTRLGHMARKIFENSGLKIKSRNDNITAAFAAALAREGLGLALTYRSCLIEDKKTTYLSIGPEGEFLRLALLLPKSNYHSLAARAFADLLRRHLRQVLSPDEAGEPKDGPVFER